MGKVGFKSPRILDIGCATGDFLYYLKGLYPDGEFTGIDVMPELLEQARSEVPSVKFSTGNICGLHTNTLLLLRQ